MSILAILCLVFIGILLVINIIEYFSNDGEGTSRMHINTIIVALCLVIGYLAGNSSKVYWEYPDFPTDGTKETK